MNYHERKVMKNGDIIMYINVLLINE